MKKDDLQKTENGDLLVSESYLKILRDSDLILVKQDAKKMQRTDSEKP